MTLVQSPRALEFAAAARAILVHESGAQTSPERVADGVALAWEKLARQFSRIVGEEGARTLLVRSVTTASATFPWLAQKEADVSDLRWAQLRTAMGKQEQDVAAEAFVSLLAAFVGLLGRLIGEGLVMRLLYEVWPSVFPQDMIKGPT